MRRTIVPLALLAVLIASVAGAELSQTYKDWPNSPAGFLLTASEKKAYAQLQGDAEAKAFIELFWAKRDQNLGAVNEFKADFDQRVAASDKVFLTEKIKGSMSDRGMVLIVLGKPLQRRVGPPPPGEEDRHEMVQLGNREEWLYTADGKPAAKKSEENWFVFQETRPGLGDFLLDRSDRRNIVARKFLADKVDKLVLHPKLTEVPRPGLLPGSKAATTAQLAVFDGGAKWPEGARVLAVSGLQTENVHPIWIYLQLPDAVPPATQAVARVRGADTGNVEGSFGGVTVTPVSVTDARAYEFSLPVGAGSWKVDVALLNDAGPVAITTVDAKNEPAPSEGVYISPFYWGADIRQEAAAHLGDPFNIGGWHVFPRLDNQYTSEESLAYFCSVVRPALNEQGKPKVELSIALYASGKKNDETPFSEVNISKVGSTDIWMFGSSLPLSSFRRGAQFEIELTVRDSIAKVSRSVKIPFTVPKPASAAPAPDASPAAKP